MRQAVVHCNNKKGTEWRRQMENPAAEKPAAESRGGFRKLVSQLAFCREGRTR